MLILLILGRVQPQMIPLAQVKTFPQKVDELGALEVPSCLESMATHHTHGVLSFLDMSWCLRVIPTFHWSEKFLC